MREREGAWGTLFNKMYDDTRIFESIRAQRYTAVHIFWHFFRSSGFSNNPKIACTATRSQASTLFQSEQSFSQGLLPLLGFGLVNKQVSHWLIWRNFPFIWKEVTIQELSYSADYLPPLEKLYIVTPQSQ